MRTRFAAIALSLLLSSTAWADLRIFDVGLEHQQEVYVALSNALNPATVGGGNASGSVQLLPNGQLLVNAQTPTLDQIEQIIKAIRARPVAAAPPVTLRYWAVLGTQPPAATASAIGTAPPPVLKDVLDELTRLSGNLAFRVIGSAAVTSDSGQKGQVSANTMSVEQRAQVQGDMVNASMLIRVQGGLGTPDPDQPRFPVGELEIRTTLKRGDFVVLGESVFEGPQAGGSVFYIVHWAENR